MKNITGFMLSAIFMTYLFISIVTLTNSYATINNATAYHNACIRDLESSNFSPTVIDSYVNNTDSQVFSVSVEEKTIQSSTDNLELPDEAYKITTTYKIMPILGVTMEKSLISFAR